MWVFNMPFINKEDLWVYIFQVGEASYSGLLRDFVEAGRCSKQTLLKYKNLLKEERKVEKRLSEETGRPVYYVPAERAVEVEALKEWRDFHDYLGKLSPETQIELMKRVRKEHRRYERQLRIKELEEMPLPAIAIAKRLKEMERKKEILCWKITVKAPSKSKAFGTLTITTQNGQNIELGNAARSPEFDREDPTKVQVKIFPEVDFASARGKVDFSREYAEGLKYMRLPWKRLFYGKIGNEQIVIAGTYTELLKLHQEEFDDKLLSWKEVYNLTDREWTNWGPHVRQMMEDGHLDDEIRNILGPYTNGKTPRGQARLKRIRKEQFGVKQGKEIAKVEIERSKRLRGKI
jgi:hypothetical protein